MSELNLFPEESSATSKVMFVNFGEEEEKFCLKLVQEIRKEGISAELYPDSVKMKKQMKYADQKSIPAVVLIGQDE